VDMTRESLDQRSRLHKFLTPKKYSCSTCKCGTKPLYFPCSNSSDPGEDPQLCRSYIIRRSLHLIWALNPTLGPRPVNLSTVVSFCDQNCDGALRRKNKHLSGILFIPDLVDHP